MINWLYGAQTKPPQIPQVRNKANKIPTETQIQGAYLKVTPKISVSQGIYLVTITTEDQTTSIKWIVE